MTKADAYVHANPWRAVAIGAGVGMALAIMLSSRRSSNSMHQSDLE
jgi:ElaB/YqjD/DUF883 family membrane-anchored ribosome-binding protein